MTALEIRPLLEIQDLTCVAASLKDHLGDPTNQDISIDFPGTIDRYGVSLAETEANLKLAQEACVPGNHELFIAYAGGNAVGMSIITFSATPLEGIDPSWPNVSGFICNPWRQRGLGALSLEARLAAVNQRFGGNAWTQVRESNTASHKLVQRIGFNMVRTIAEEPENKILYTYSSSF